MSDQRYAVRFAGSGTAETPYALVSAYELEDDGEWEFEDDFFKRQLTFEGNVAAGSLRIVAQESSYNGFTEVKTYKQIGSIQIDGQDYAVIIRESEYLMGSSVEVEDKPYGTSSDDDFRGDSRSEDVYFAFAGLDRIDCKGVAGKKAGIYYDRASGGDDSDEFILGKSSNSCYYDDKRRGRETFLYADDFGIDDKLLFLKPFKRASRYELREVSNSRYQDKLERVGLFGVEMVLVDTKDREDILACLKFDDSSIAPPSGWTATNVLG